MDIDIDKYIAIDILGFVIKTKNRNRSINKFNDLGYDR